MNTIKISAESLQSFQHDKNVAENQLPEPPALIVEQFDGTLKEFSQKDILVCGTLIDMFAHQFGIFGFELLIEPSDLIEQMHPHEYKNFLNAFEELYKAHEKIECVI